MKISKFIYFFSLAGLIIISSCKREKFAPPGTILVIKLQNPLSMTQTATDLYVASFGGVYLEGAGITKVPKDGSAPVSIFANGERISGIISDDQNLYWESSTLTDATLYKMAFNNTVPTVLSKDFGSGIIHEGYMYGSDNSVYGSIARMPLGGGLPDTLIRSQTFPSSLVIRDGYIYWATGYENDTKVGKIKRASLVDLKESVLASDQYSPGNLQVDGGFVYWITNSDQDLSKNSLIKKVSINGGDIQVLRPNEEYPRALTVKDNTIYWMNFGSLQKMSVTGSDYKLLASGVHHAEVLVVDDAYIYFINGDELRKTPR